MARWAAILVVLAVALAAGLWYGRQKGLPWAQWGRPAKTTEAWAPERIAQDPAGYLAHAAKQIEAQITERKSRRQTLLAKRDEITAKSDALRTKIADTENVRRRMQSAMQRATDENQWPLRFAGRSYSRPQAEAILSACDQFLADRKPLTQAYEDALRRVREAQQAFEGSISDLTRMQEKIALDLERVRLNQGMTELAQLRQRAAEVASFSQTLVDLSTDPLAGVSVPAEDERSEMTLNTLLGKP